MSKRDWFVLRVTPNSEISTEKLVRRLGYDAMAPYREGERYTARRKKSRPWKWPLFPGYLFASWPDWCEGWNRVKGKVNPAENIPAIYDFLGPEASLTPSRLLPADVDYLLSIADGKYKSGDSEPRIRVGDYVMVSSGPFQGCSVTVLDVSGKNATIEVPGTKMTSNVKIRLAKLEKV